MLRVSRATDSLFHRVAAQDAGLFLRRSDYPHIYDSSDLEDAFDSGWHHYHDEPDLLHKTTDRGMTFSIHPAYDHNTGAPVFPMYLHNPEGVSLTGNFGSLPEATNAENDITSGRKKIKDVLSPDPIQGAYVRHLRDAVQNGGSVVDGNGYTHTVDGARHSLERMKASEEAVAAGGESLYNNLIEAHKRHGWDA